MLYSANSVRALLSIPEWNTRHFFPFTSYTILNLPHRPDLIVIPLPALSSVLCME